MVILKAFRKEKSFKELVESLELLLADNEVLAIIKDIAETNRI
jgi:hypothetical protein